MTRQEAFLKALEQFPHWTVAECRDHQMVRASSTEVAEWRRDGDFAAAETRLIEKRRDAARDLRRRVKHAVPVAVADEEDARKVLAAFADCPELGMDEACRQFRQTTKAVMAAVRSSEELERLYEEALMGVVAPVERLHLGEMLSDDPKMARFRRAFLERHRPEIFGREPVQQESGGRGGTQIGSLNLVQIILQRTPRVEKDATGKWRFPDVEGVPPPSSVLVGREEVA